MDAQAMRGRAALWAAIVFAATLPVAAIAAHVAPAKHHVLHHTVHPPAPRARPQLVLKVDKVTAMTVQRKLVITVDGAVPTGGWQHPRLVAKPSRPEAPVLVFRLVADPPPQNRVVIKELLPVRVTLTRGLPHYGTVAVEIMARTNEITTQIIP
jgi:hypothetical protein